MADDPNRDALAQTMAGGGDTYTPKYLAGGGLDQNDPGNIAQYFKLMGGGGGGGMPAYSPPPQQAWSPPAMQQPQPQAPAGGGGGGDGGYTPAYLAGGGLNPNDPGNIAQYYKMMGGGGGGYGGGAPAAAPPASSGPLSGDALLMAMANAGYAYPTGMRGPTGTGGGIQWSNTGQIPSNDVFNSFINGTYNASGGPAQGGSQVGTGGMGVYNGGGGGDYNPYSPGGGLTGAGGGSDFFGGGSNPYYGGYPSGNVQGPYPMPNVNNPYWLPYDQPGLPGDSFYPGGGYPTGAGGNFDRSGAY
jgi:hypothetical protein